MWQERTERLIGADGLEKLKQARVAVFGIGGVGSYAVEALARNGVGTLCLADGDIYAETNINRQLYATLSSLGRSKAETAAERVHDINPLCEVTAVCRRFTVEDADSFDLSRFDFVIDAIDSLDCKTELIARCFRAGIPIVSCMGAGNRTKAYMFTVGDIFSVTNDPLAKALRSRLRKEGVTSLKAVYSTEIPAVASRPVGSLCHVTAVAGMLLAGEATAAILSKQ